ncbi:DEAD-box ATP-dependent RNA helicase 28-like [Juglans regia]|uniref:DEAD-box ATP-dependent RNA helicase 28-like n=1 Tax=Juglans regia TaxID=51240 RepID=A0A6P9E2U5_JUGRE|nr:DEAD-box ATP-dependent RNA helicase 28-like [Juglans regia]
MEDQVAAVLQEESEARALRKAEMEATKAENMIAYKDEIYSRPKKTWFVTEREKACCECCKENFASKKRRKLEAARETLEDKNQINKLEGNGKINKEKTGKSLVDVGYTNGRKQ